ncbi:MAG: hypothetical protein AAB257_01450, partial [Nitrospinota bacterium]
QHPEDLLRIPRIHLTTVSQKCKILFWHLYLTYWTGIFGKINIHLGFPFAIRLNIPFLPNPVKALKKIIP